MDTETVSVSLPDGTTGHKLAFGWAYGTRRKVGDTWAWSTWLRFETPVEFWDWVETRALSRSRLIIYCHNAEFDAKVVDAFGEMERRGWTLVAACLEGPPTIVRWRRKGTTIQWLDTLNWFRESLAKLGERVGLPKLDMPESWSDRELADQYCRRDVEIVWKTLLEWWSFIRRHDLGTAAPTLASQSFTAFRHRFMKHEILIDTQTQALALSRAAYVGGRCECFRFGRIDATTVVLDVNSMYPAVMATLECPIRLLTVRARCSVAMLADYLTRYSLVADVSIETDEPVYPRHIDGRLCFPVGRFRVALATPELTHALSHSRIGRVHAIAVYARAPIFAEWVNWVWSTRLAAKRAGDEVMSWMCRMLGNSLYGKFGQRGRHWDVIAECDTSRVSVDSSYDLDTGQWTRRRQIGHALQELRTEGESAHSFPAIAAHVTSAARLMLWSYLTRAGRDNVYYTDTDSLIGDVRIINRLSADIDPERLGALKHEGTHDWVEIRGPKDYRTPSYERIKGIRSKRDEVAPGVYRQEQWEGWSGALRRGDLTMPRTWMVDKALARTYRKGTVGADGRVSPLFLDDW